MINVLMALYNGVEFLEQSLASLQAQTYPDWVLTIGINGYPPKSTLYQDVCKIVERDSRVVVLDLHEAKGKSQALNMMVEVNGCEWVAILDVDDYWAPTKLQAQLPFIGPYQIIGTLGTYCGHRSDEIPVKPGEVAIGDLRSVNMIINSSAVLRAEDAWWDPQFEGVEDYDLWARLALRGRKTYNVPERLTWHRLHSGSAFNTKRFDDKITIIRHKMRHDA